MNNDKYSMARHLNLRLRLLSQLRIGLVLMAAGLLPYQAIAQVVPDAGRLLQDSLPTPLQPLEPSVDLPAPREEATATPLGGPTVQLGKITLSGNTIYSDETLLNVLGAVDGQDSSHGYDLAGLRQLTDHISQYYHTTGYPFARAYLPEQNMTGGILTIAVLEGRYGVIRASGDASLTAASQTFLAMLHSGDVIEADRLKRTMLILADQPGINVIPIIRAGTDTGSADLEVSANKASRISGQLSIDNYGNRYSGEYRAVVELQINRAITFGDEITVRGLYSSEDLWLGQLAYALPIGHSGLRGRVSYAHTDYDLRDPYAGYTGTAKITTVGLSYPLIRSRASNLVAAVSYQYKDLNDELLSSSYEKKSSYSWPLSVQFDHRDNFGGGGLSYGDLSFTPGRLDSDTPFATQGGFTKVNIRLVRIQNLPANFSLFTTFSGQWSDNDLDSSETFTLGGAYGVRAYPQGEVTGSKGGLGQLELRYAIHRLSPYLFYDAGHITCNAEEQRRSIAGGGIGLRYDNNDWSLNLVSAWKTVGGEAKSDSKQRDPRVWFSVTYRL